MSIYDVLIGDAAIIPYDYVVVCKHIQFELIARLIGGPGGRKEGLRVKKTAACDLRQSVKIDYFLERYSSMAFAATLPAPMAEMTVAAPVTASPPA